EIYCDGGARGNPGPAACAAVIKNAKCKISNDKKCKSQVLEKVSKYLGPILTNNQAEYLAVIEGLKAAKKYQPDKVTVFMDSELAVEQLNLRYKLKNKGLKEPFDEVMTLKLSFPVVEFKYIPREENKEADRLVNKILNSKQKNLKTQNSNLKSTSQMSNLN
ncbi:MAG: ribonuclease HI family protein, partial [Candidatus Cloacimonetes bacterium]|nr:ribonuclease HI family protein [Candidatus Cloacimonadota bacterium]